MRRFALFFLPLPLLATTWYVNLGGLGGQEDYESRFKAQIEELNKLTAAAPGARVFSFAGPALSKIKVRDALAQIAREAKPDDTLVLTLIGHGTFDGSDYKFNIPGPDISAKELALWLLPVPAKRQLVVNTTSASGASLADLRQEGRTVITATKSGTEKLATVFARFWLEALRDPQSDADKNDIVSALEA